jgi:hypothetical protein
LIQVIPASKTGTLAAWWGFADADPTVVGVVVVALAALAVAYVVMRLTRGRIKKD